METLVTLSLRFPTVDRAAVAAQIIPAVEQAIAAGGTYMSLSIQPYDESEDED